MAERSNAAVLKTVDCNRSGGSNPSLSASAHRSFSAGGLFFFTNQPAIPGGLRRTQSTSCSEILYEFYCCRPIIDKKFRKFSHIPPQTRTNPHQYDFSCFHLLSERLYIVSTTRNWASPLNIRSNASAAFCIGYVSTIGRTPVNSAKRNVSSASIGEPVVHP